MKKSNIEEFKNSILAKEIHRSERSDKFENYLDSAEYYIFLRKKNDKYFTDQLWRTNENFPFSYPSIHDAFEQIAMKILYFENIINVINELNSKNYKIRIAISDNSYYSTIYKDRINEGKSVLRKLRPFVLECAIDFSEERKQKILNSDIGGFFKGWYL